MCKFVLDNLPNKLTLCSGEFSLCRVNNGGCQDLCLLTSEGRVNCSCRGDRKLLEDNTCIGNAVHLILTLFHLPFYLYFPKKGRRLSFWTFTCVFENYSSPIRMPFLPSCCSTERHVQSHRWVWVRKWRLRELHVDLRRHGPLQGQIWWEAVLLWWEGTHALFQWPAKTNICVLCCTLFHSGLVFQPIVRAKRASGVAWMAAVSGITPGVMDKTTAETIPMSFSVTVSHAIYTFLMEMLNLLLIVLLQYCSCYR